MSISTVSYVDYWDTMLITRLLAYFYLKRLNVKNLAYTAFPADKKYAHFYFLDGKFFD